VSRDLREKAEVRMLNCSQYVVKRYQYIYQFLNTVSSHSTNRTKRSWISKIIGGVLGLQTSEDASNLKHRLYAAEKVLYGTRHQVGKLTVLTKHLITCKDELFKNDEILSSKIANMRDVIHSLTDAMSDVYYHIDLSQKCDSVVATSQQSQSSYLHYLTQSQGAYCDSMSEYLDIYSDLELAVSNSLHGWIPNNLIPVSILIEALSSPDFSLELAKHRFELLYPPARILEYYRGRYGSFVGLSGSMFGIAIRLPGHVEGGLFDLFRLSPLPMYSEALNATIQFTNLPKYFAVSIAGMHYAELDSDWFASCVGETVYRCSQPFPSYHGSNPSCAYTIYQKESLSIIHEICHSIVLPTASRLRISYLGDSFWYLYGPHKPITVQDGLRSYPLTSDVSQIIYVPHGQLVSVGSINLPPGPTDIPGKPLASTSIVRDYLTLLEFGHDVGHLTYDDLQAPSVVEKYVTPVSPETMKVVELMDNQPEVSRGVSLDEALKYVESTGEQIIIPDPYSLNIIQDELSPMNSVLTNPIFKVTIAAVSVFNIVITIFIILMVVKHRRLLVSLLALIPKPASSLPILNPTNRPLIAVESPLTQAVLILMFITSLLMAMTFIIYCVGRCLIQYWSSRFTNISCPSNEISDIQNCTLYIGLKKTHFWYIGPSYITVALDQCQDLGVKWSVHSGLDPTVLVLCEPNGKIEVRLQVQKGHIKSNGSDLDRIDFIETFWSPSVKLWCARLHLPPNSYTPDCIFITGPSLFTIIHMYGRPNYGRSIDATKMYSLLAL